MSATTINRLEYDVPTDAVTAGPDMNTILRIAGVTGELTPEGAQSLLTQLTDNTPRVCAVCFGHRFTDGARIFECTWCQGAGYTR